MAQTNKNIIIIAAVGAIVLLAAISFAILNQPVPSQEGNDPIAEQVTATITPTPNEQEATPTSEAEEEEEETIPGPEERLSSLDDPVVVDARVVPQRSVELRANSPSMVEEVLVEEGDEVEAGDVLIQLDTRDLELRVEDARLNVEEMKLGIAENEAAFEEQIRQSRADLQRAQNQFGLTQSNVSQKDIDAAQAQLEQARAALADVQAGADTVEIQTAREAVRQAEENLQIERDTLSAAKTTAESTMRNAANELRNRQAEYSRIYWQNRNKGDLDQQDKDSEQAALRAVEDAQEQLEQAEVNFDLSKQAEINGIEVAESNLRAAQSRLEDLLSGPESDELAAARAQVARAESNLDQLIGQQRSLELQQASINVGEAQENLESALEQLNDPTFIASSETRIQRAEFALRQAELALERATITAPMNGTIAQVNLREGDIPTIGEVMLIMADFSSWRLETGNLDELSITRLEEGDEAIITFDAIPDFEMRGNVTNIGRIGENRDGEITYNLTITPREWDDRLRWNMTASVTIIPSR